jgi:Glycosyl transferase family 2
MWSWVSERDRGQTDVSVKGLSLACGDVLAWVDPDTVLEPEALEAVGQAYRSSPGSLIAGNVKSFPESTGRERLLRHGNLNFEDMVKISTWRPFYSQPGVFFPRQAYVKAGGLDVNLHYCMDHDLMIGFAANPPGGLLGPDSGPGREQPASRTCSP